MIETIALLTARLIFAAVFLMACGFKFAGMDATAGYTCQWTSSLTM